LTPFVTELVYDYYDVELDSWETLSRFENDEEGEPMIPNRVRLRFEHDGMVKETILSLPQATASIAIF